MRKVKSLYTLTTYPILEERDGLITEGNGDQKMVKQYYVQMRQGNFWINHGHVEVIEDSD